MKKESAQSVTPIMETTPGPWTVEPHPDTEGAYIVKEARYEQQTWGPAGYDISDEEGNRRDLVVEQRDANNIRLIQAASALFEALKNVLLFPDRDKHQAIAALQSVSLHWQALVTINKEYVNQLEIKRR